MDLNEEGKDWWSGFLYLQFPRRKMSCPVASSLSPPSLTRAISFFLGVGNWYPTCPQKSFHIGDISALDTAPPRWVLSTTSWTKLCWANSAGVGFKSQDHLEASYLLPTQGCPGEETACCLNSLSISALLFSLHLHTLDSRAQTF